MKDADGTEYFVFLTDKLKPEVELIHLMSDRSNLKLLQLQIYRANKILLLFSKNSHLTKYSAQEQEKGMSRILSGSTSMVQTETHSLVKTTKKGSPMLTAAGLFKGNVFYGGNFTINISLSSSPTEAQKQQTYK